MAQSLEDGEIRIMIEENCGFKKKRIKKFGVSDFSATFVVPNGSIAQLV